MKVRCPHCHHPIEVLDDSSFEDVECPSCGSSFNLLKDTATVSYAPEKGQTISHFQLVEKIGTGSFGTVWKARDTELDRIVAVKVPRKTDLDEDETEKFLREARAAAQLHHPHIVAVHEVGRVESTVYIVADLVQGLTLSDWLSGQLLTPREAAALCVTLAQALHHAHEAGVIHRDLKPSNIMLDREGQPHVMDFGLAKREAGEITMTVEGQIIGTPAYMSPEQARGDSHDVDRRSDIYSLGVILFELLTNERPFRGNARMLLHQVIHEEAPSPRKLNASVPRDLATICLKCLEKDPSRRFRSASELADELQRFIKGEPITARPVSQVERLWRWTYRNPIVATLSVGLIAVMLFLAVTGPVVYFRERELRQTAEANAHDADRARMAAVVSQGEAEKARNQALAAKQLAEVEARRAEQEAERATNALTAEEEARRAAESAESRAQLELDRATLHSQAASLARDTVVVSRDTIRRNLYFAEMGLAHQALLDHDISQVNQILDRHVPEADETDLRDFEWYYLRHAGHRYQHQFPWRGIYDVSVSTRGDLIAVDGAPGGDGNRPVMLLLDPKTYLQQAVLPGEMWGPTVSSFSNEGQYLTAGDHGGTVYLWSLADHKLLWKRQPYEQRVYLAAVAFSPDQTKLAVVCGGTTGRLSDVLILNATDGTLERRLSTKHGFAKSLAYLANDELIVGSGYERLDCWNPQTGESYWTTCTEEGYQKICSHYNWISSLAPSPDQQHLAATYNLGHVRLIDRKTGHTLVQRDEHQQRVNKVTYSPDGSLLASASQDGSCLLRDPKTLHVMASIEHGEACSGVAFTRDGKSVISTGPRGMKVWNLNDVLSSSVRLEGTASSEHRMAVSADGTLIATAGHPRGVQVRRAGESSPFQEFPIGGMTLNFRNVDDEWQLVTTDSRSLWIAKMDGTHSRFDLPAATFSVAHSGSLSHDGKLLALTHPSQEQRNSIIRIWEVDTLAMVREFPVTAHSAVALSFTPDDQQVYSVHHGPSVTGIIVWNLADGTHEVLRPVSDGGPNCRATLDLKQGLIASSIGRVIDVYDVHTRQSICTCEGHSYDVMCLALFPDGKRLASGAIDHTLRLWDLPSGQVTQIYRDHSGQVESLAIADEGETLLSTARDNTLRCWKAERRLPLTGMSRMSSVTNSPDGRLIATSGVDDRTFRVWDRSSRQLLLEDFHPSLVFHATAFSTDSRHVATYATSQEGATVQSYVHIYSVETGEQIQVINLGINVYRGSLVFNQDSRNLIVGNRDGLSLWSLETGRKIRSTALPDPPAPNASIDHIALSPDGKQVATGETSGMLRIWDATTMSLVRSVQLFHDPFVDMAYLENANILAGSRSHIIKEVSTKTLDVEAESGIGYLGMFTMTCSRDGRHVFVGMGGPPSQVVHLQRTGSRFNEVDRWQDYDYLGPLCLAPEGNELLICAHDGWATFWDIDSKRATGRLVAGGDKAHYPVDIDAAINNRRTPQFSGFVPYYVNNEKASSLELENLGLRPVVTVSKESDPSVCFDTALDGRLLIVGCENSLQWIDLKDKSVLRVITEFRAPLSKVACSPDSRLVASGDRSGVVSIWHVDDGGIALQSHAFVGEIKSIVWSQDSDSILVLDQTGVHRIDAATGAINRQLTDSAMKVIQLTATDDPGKFMLMGEPRRIAVYDSATMTPVVELPEDSAGEGWLSPDSTLIGTTTHARKSASVWDVTSGKKIAMFHSEFNTSHFVFLSASTAVVCNSEGRMWLWDFQTGATRRLRIRHPAGIEQGLLSKVDGRTFLITGGGQNGIVEVWDFDEETLGLQIDAVSIARLAGSLDGKADSLELTRVGLTPGTMITHPLSARSLNRRFRSHAIAAANSGQQVAVCCEDLAIRLFDCLSGKYLVRLDGAIEALDHLAFSPDDRWLAAIGRDRILRVWDVETAALAFESKSLESPAQEIVWSGDSNVVLTVSGQHLWSFELPSGVIASRDLGIDHNVWRVCAVPQRNELFMANANRGIQVYDLADQGLKPAFDDPSRSQIDQMCQGYGRLAVRCSDKSVRIYDLASRKQLSEKTFSDAGRAFTFVDSDSLAVTMEDGSLLLWDFVKDQTAVRPFNSSFATTAMVTAQLPDRTFLATMMGGEGIVEVWETDNWSLRHQIDTRSLAIRAVLPENAIAARAQTAKSDGIASGIDSDEQNLFDQSLHRRGTDVAFSPDGSLVAASVGTEVRVWKSGTGERVFTFNEAQWRQQAVVFAQNGQFLIAGGTDRTIRAWRLSDGQLILELPTAMYGDAIGSLVLTSDGKTLLSSHSAQPGRVIVWDVSDLARPIVKGECHLKSNWQHSLALSSDEKYFATNGKESNCKTQVWKLEDCQELYCSQREHKKVRFLPGRPEEMLCSTGVKGIFVNWKTGKVSKDFATLGAVRDWEFSKNGERIVVGYLDGKVRVFDVENWAETPLQPMSHLLRIGSVSVSPNGRAITSVGGEGLVKLWNAETGELIRRLE